jgi:hypothetical protein
MIAKMSRVQNKETILIAARQEVPSYLQRKVFQNSNKPLDRNPKGKESMGRSKCQPRLLYPAVII